MISQQDRLNMRAFGWANQMLNVAFIAGKMRRHPDNPRLLLVQQTPALEQSIPVITPYSLSSSAYPDGTYVSVFAHLRGQTRLGVAGKPSGGAAILSALHVRYVEAREVDMKESQQRLEAALGSTNLNATTGDLRPMDVALPPELAAFEAITPSADGDASPDSTHDEERDNRPDRVSMLKGSNIVKIAGVIGFMEHRPSSQDATGSDRLTLYVQQHRDLERAIPVRIYGRQAAAAVDVYDPGVAIHVAGQLLVDVKRNSKGVLVSTPYIKTFSVELAQPMVHIRTAPYPVWAKELFTLGQTPAGFARLTKRIRSAQDGRGEVPAVDGPDTTLAAAEDEVAAADLAADPV